MPESQDRAVKFLDAINKLSSFETADEVAAFLAAEGVKGKCYEPYKCAVAEYLLRAVGGPDAKVFVNTYGARLWLGDSARDAAYPNDLNLVSAFAQWDVRGPVIGFIDRFDDGRYPDLIDNPPVPA